jgi:PEP-CTERM motif
MRRLLFTLCSVVLGSAVATAEPLPWSYEIRFKAAGFKDTILLGSENWDGGQDGQSSLWYATLGTYGPGIRMTGSETEMGRTTLLGFSNGTWSLSEAPPPAETTSEGAFDLFWTFTAANGEMTTGSERGSISAGGFFTSGSGNFMVGLDVTREITMNGKRVAVQFSAMNSESASRIEMTVTNAPLAETPEPATLLLAGVGVAGVGLFRKRRKSCASPGR